MAFTKTIAGHFKKNLIDVFNEHGEVVSQTEQLQWVDQVTIPMHPLEEATIVAFQDVCAAHAAIPVEPTLDQKMAWMIEGGSALVQTRIQEWEQLVVQRQPAYEAAVLAEQIASLAWQEHVTNCLANGVDPNAT